jgi:hypothetical protein
MNLPQNTGAAAGLIAQLKNLEYEIRRSITVREDQEDAAEPQHIDVACSLDIQAEAGASKGDLLSAVQTRLRAAQASDA